MQRSPRSQVIIDNTPVPFRPARGLRVPDVSKTSSSAIALHIAHGLDRRREHFDQQQLALAALLERWDPIGVHNRRVNDWRQGEYDDLVRPIQAFVIHQQPTTRQLRQALCQVLADDYGITDPRHTRRTSRRIRRLLRRRLKPVP